MALPIRERQYSLEAYLALDERCPERLEGEIAIPRIEA